MDISILFASSRATSGKRLNRKVAPTNEQLSVINIIKAHVSSNINDQQQCLRVLGIDGLNFYRNSLFQII